MKLVRFDDSRVGVLDGQYVVDVTVLFGETIAAEVRMRTLIAEWDELAQAVARLAVTGPRRPTSSVALLAPIDPPSKIIAAPVNYRDHTAEMVDMVGEQVVEKFKGFLKAPSSLAGPGDLIQMPFPDRRTDYEGELAVVIGRTARGISAADALDYIFGYLPLLDMTVRGDEDRSFRKSADTFTPVGPALVTADEVGAPSSLRLRLWLNDELRQDASTADLVWDVPKLIETYSHIMTLHPGDVVATGTPSGVGAVAPGDRIRLTIDRMPTLEMTVAGPARHERAGKPTIDTAARP